MAVTRVVRASESDSPSRSPSPVAAGCSSYAWQFPDILAERNTGTMIPKSGLPDTHQEWVKYLPPSHFRKYENDLQISAEELEVVRKKSWIADFLARLPTSSPGRYRQLVDIFAPLEGGPLKCAQWEGLATLWYFHSQDLGCKESFMPEEAMKNCIQAHTSGQRPAGTHMYE